MTKFHHSPAWLWLLSFILCIGGDALLQRWVLLPLYIAGFYGGMIVIDLCAYPLLTHWRNWLRGRSPWAWYLVEVGAMWIGTTLILIALSPWWLDWTWRGPFVFQLLGALLIVTSVVIGVWAVGQMGWARVLFAAALFVPGGGAEEHDIPQKLVLSGPYRYVRNPLYLTDMTLIFGTALLTQNWALLVLLAAYIAQLIMQLQLEERELHIRFGEDYRQYTASVPRFLPRLFSRNT